MIKLSDNKGITLVALIVTIIIVMILAVSITASTKTTSELKEYYSVKEDIIALTEEVQRYYLDNEELPTKGDKVSFSIPTKDRNPNDNANYYEIDNAKLNVQLKNTNYTYLINEESLTVYCKEGVVLNGEVHYTIVDDFQGGSYAGEYYENVELPIISLVSFTSNENNKCYAKDKSILTLRMLKNYNFTTEPTVTINGTAVTPTWNSRIGTATYVVEGDKCTEGQEIPFNISNYAADGRMGNAITRPTFGNVVIYKSNDISPDGLPYADNTKPYLPEGFTKVDGTDLNNGLVVSDINGNEYVWVEVPYNIFVNATSNIDYNNIEKDLHNYSADYSSTTGSKDEWYSKDISGLENSDYTILKNKMLKSLYDNGGFWVGRYEVGDSKGTVDNTSYGSTKKAVIKQNQIPYTNATCAESQALAESFTPVNSRYNTSLLFGIQWDLVLSYLESKENKATKDERQADFLIDSSGWGNFYDSEFDIKNPNAKYLTHASWESAGTYTKEKSSGVEVTTGASEKNSKQNIFDLGGNVWEWTLEHSTNENHPCVYRGGRLWQYGFFYSSILSY